ncbi:MAG TPA: hypothetical protein VG406_11345 [Isosphaeraceae bacterium]|jgi:hypothetical protein|nr:hypothetical protein [Isosphaeraceae bacterium]
MDKDGARGRRALRWALGAAFAAIVLAPYADRLRHASLYGDDVVRVAQLQMHPLRAILFLPFNEHMAPVFQTISWTAWNAAGHRLVAAPWAFTVASYVPFVPCLALLGLVARRETGSTAASLVAVAIFALSWLPIEVVFWYSASSFLWALLFTLTAWHGAEAATRRARGGVVVAALAACLAPACSAIGLLAGPVAALRALLAGDATPRAWRLAIAAPLLGTMAYLAVSNTQQYRGIVAQSVVERTRPIDAVVAIGLAPADVLVPALFGVRNVDDRMPKGLAIGLGALGLVAALAMARRRGSRPLVLGALGLIVGGYALTYAVRSAPNPHWVLEVQRYHLFPQAGLALVIAAASRPWLARLDANPTRALAVATAVAALLWVSHRDEMKARGRFYRYAEQGRTLAALDRLAATCRTKGITREQAIRALDPVLTKWFPYENFNVLDLLPRTVPTPSVPDADVRRILLESMGQADREAVCGGMDASPYLNPDQLFVEDLVVAVGRRVPPTDAWNHIRAAGPGRYTTDGWPSHVEFELVAPTGRADDARFLCIPGGSPGQWMEVWWAGPAGAWSESRSIRWRPDPAREAAAWSLDLARLPHWRTDDVRRLRVFFRKPGTYPLGEPRLIAE